MPIPSHKKIIIDNLKRYYENTFAEVMPGLIGIQYQKPKHTDKDHLMASFLNGRFYYDETIKKSYLYYVLDPNIIYGRHDLARDTYIKMKENLSVRKVSGVETEILGPTEYCLEKSLHVYENNSKINEYTTNYWVSMDGEYRFIDDKSLTIFDKYRKSVDEGKVTDWIDGWRLEIKELNEAYNNFKNPDDIPAGFAEYKAMYKNTFGRELHTMQEDDIGTFILLNATDYYLP